jgi:nucleoid-associated protein YgaU
MFIVIAMVAQSQESIIPLKLKDSTTLQSYVDQIDKQIEIKTEKSTKILAATLSVLHSDDLYTHKELGRYPDAYYEPETNGFHVSWAHLSLKSQLFDQVAQELFNRGGAVVVETLKPMLTANILEVDDKAKIRNFLIWETGADVPFSYSVTDKRQKNKIVLLFTPVASKTVITKNGDTLVGIAKQEYPKLSKWSGVEVISFINDIDDSEYIHVEQQLKIYSYNLLKFSERK